MITKELCKEHALKIYKDTGVFPVYVDWKKSKGFPCGISKLVKLFDGSYNNFRNFCGVQEEKRTSPISIEWIKNNCNVINDCWEWSKSLFPNGYGQIRVKNTTFLLHRFTYELVYGTIPENLLVRHKCDNRKCCNPKHLELGNYHENNLDTIIRNDSLVFNYNKDLISKIKSITSLEERVNFYSSNTEPILGECIKSSLLQEDNNGYYNISFNNKSYRFHRLILAIKLKKSYEEIKIARHTCNNKNCINPNHIVEGDYSDNAIDSRNFSKKTKLTENNVVDIKLAMLKEDFSKHGSKQKFDRFWADKLKVSIGTITYVRLGKTWKNITP